MRRIIASESIAASGQFAGPDGEIDWQSLDDEFNAASVELLDRVDAILCGRVTYELFRSYWPTATGSDYEPAIARRMNAHEKLVVSARDDLDLSWGPATRLGGEPFDELRDLKRRPGGDIALLGSGTLLTGLLEHGLVDECRIVVNPIALGAGRPLFQGLAAPSPLSLAGVDRYRSGAVVLTYEPAAAA